MPMFNQIFAIMQPSVYGNSKFCSHNQRLSFYAHSKYSTSYQATVLAFQRFTNVTVSGLTGTAWEPADPSYLSPPHPRCNKCSTHYYPTLLSPSSSSSPWSCSSLYMFQSRLFLFTSIYKQGYAVAQMAGALHYKPEGSIPD